ncbi:SDR family oxidoreductase [Micrococcus luteus]|uniref:SDR family oxidoreductase n=1 Tax=Micrococcus luteus TaxID=1270 RepID=UPI003642EC05
MDRRVLVIGAGGGLGSQISVSLKDCGWRVSGCGRNVPNAVADVFEEFVQVDLGAEDAVEKLISSLPSTEYRLVVMNAVDYGPKGCDDPELADMERVFRVNALNPYRLLRGLVNEIPLTVQCSIVVVNSDAIFGANRTSGTYAASKAALRVFTSALADVCRGTNVSVATLLLGPLKDSKKMEMIRETARRLGRAEEDVIRMFLSRTNSYFVIDDLIDLRACVRSIEYLAAVGSAGNGMLCRLDGGAAGSLV